MPSIVVRPAASPPAPLREPVRADEPIAAPPAPDASSGARRR